MSAASGNGAGPIPYRRGWRAPWRGQWGTFSDGHSRISYLARRIHEELRAEYHGDTPLQARRLWLAARYLALAETTLTGIGRDPKASRRAVTALQKVADAQLAWLRRDSNGHGNGHAGDDLAARLLALPTAADQRSRP